MTADNVDGAPSEVTFEKVGRKEVEAFCSVCQAIIGTVSTDDSKEEWMKMAEWHVRHDQDHMSKLGEQRVKEDAGC